MGATMKAQEKAASRRGTTPGSLPRVRLRSPLGMALEEYRLAKGLGLNELAKLAGVQPAQLSRLEGGHQVTARGDTLRKLAAALDLEVDHLMRLAASGKVLPKTVAETDRGRSATAADVSAAIERDPTIPPARKRWLHECVALARMAK